MATFLNSKTKAIVIAFVWARIAFSSLWQGMPFRCMQSKTEKNLMSEAAILEKIESLSQTVARLRQRVEDLEDLRDLEAAIADNGDKPLIPWERVKTELELG